MLRYYGSLSLRAFVLLFNETDRVLTAIAVAAFLATLYNREAGKVVTATWEGFDPWWAVAPVVLLVLYGLMKANYERHVGLEQTVAQLTAERDTLRQRFDDRQKMREAADRLGELLEAGRALSRQRGMSEEEFPAWEIQVEQWAETTANWLAQRYSPAEVSRFRSARGTSRHFFNVTNEHHQNALNWIDARLTLMDDIIARSSGLAAPPSSSPFD